MAYNRFGAVYTSVVSLYPGTAVGDYGTQANVEEAIDRAVDLIAQAMPETVFMAITNPQLERVVSRATAGQTTTSAVRMKPVIAGTVHAWRGQPSQFVRRPSYLTDAIFTGQVEMDVADYSVTNATGVLTMVTPLNVNDAVYVSYMADTDSASFSLPSLARLAVRGAAAELGARLYSEANQEWKLVEEYRTGFQNALDALLEGKLIPDEIRLASYWHELAPASGTVGSVLLFRG
jgi:hypothetical protein